MITIIGYGAIGRALIEMTAHDPAVQIKSVVVKTSSLRQVKEQLAQKDIAVHDEVPPGTSLLLECAGQEAVTQHLPRALERGVECGLLSLGALADEKLYVKLKESSIKNRSQLHLLAGAIGGLETLATAKFDVLKEVNYTGSKPPRSWKGTPAEENFDLDSISQEVCVFSGTARQASRKFPKNANVTAALALAGMGFDKTKVTLNVDPFIAEAIHKYSAKGGFGEFNFNLQNFVLTENPKTSKLTILSALRFLKYRASFMGIAETI
jgi:aspartate dehydrogenase